MERAIDHDNEDQSDENRDDDGDEVDVTTEARGPGVVEAGFEDAAGVGLAGRIGGQRGDLPRDGFYLKWGRGAKRRDSYTLAMARSSKGAGKSTVRYALRREEFAAITAVEGLKLTPEAEKRLKETESLPPDERMAVVIRAHTGRRAR